MDIIVVSYKRGRTWRLKLAPENILAWVPVVLVVAAVCSVSFLAGYASRGVYVGKSISRHKLDELPADAYLAQRYAPHPVIDRDGKEWKYDVRFFADRGRVIGAAARVFHGQVVGMRTPGSGFAPIQVGSSCCLIGALAAASCDQDFESCSTP